MKFFLVSTGVSPIIDFFANDGRVIHLLVTQIARVGHAIADVGATLMPSIGG